MRTTPATVAEHEAVLAVKERFAEAIVDQIVPHHEVKAIIDRYITNAKDYQYGRCTRKARDILNAELGAVIVCVPRSGYRRLNSVNGVAYAGEHPLIKVRRTVRRGHKQLTNAVVHSNDLTASQRRQAVQRMATLGLIEHLTKAKTVATMPEEPPPPSDPLKPLRDSLGI